MATTQSHFDTLEAVLDQTDLNEVIKMLARICHEKAEHVRSNWQDENMAKAWERNANKLGKVESMLVRTY